MNTLTQTIAISKDTVSELPTVDYTGGITVVDTVPMARMAVRELTKARVVGFDTETRPSFTRGRMNKVSLLQLSTADHCFLFRLNKIGVPAALKRFLEDPEIIKIGLSVHDDYNAMRRLAPELDPQGFIDLQEYVKYFHINDLSLQKIYAIVFSEKISKHQRLTNWEAETLTEPQQKYAALDAWACLRLYRTLRSGGFHPDESPYIVDRALLCPSQNNQLIGPRQAAEQAEAQQRAEQARQQTAQPPAEPAKAEKKPKRRRRAAPNKAKEAPEAQAKTPKAAKPTKPRRTKKTKKE